MLTLLPLLALSHDCQHTQVFQAKDISLDEQDYDSRSASKALGLDFEVVYDTSHCLSRGQVIQRIVSCSRSETYVCRDEDVLTSEKKNFLQGQVIPSAVSFWQNTLETDATSISVSKGKCCAIDVSATRNSNAKYLLFVSFHPSDAGTIAWAGACRVDQNGRPFAGHANFGPNLVNLKKFEDAFKTGVHELAHALGFSSSLFSGFKRVDSRGQLVAHSEVVKKVTERGHTVSKVVTPNVIKFVADHFKCPYMTNPGAELEDGGGEGTAGSHWEKRIFHNELMVGSTAGGSIISPLTLAMFADMGWYRVKYTHNAVGTLKWGKGLGCSFVQDRCSSWPKNYFCAASKCESGYKSCSVDRTSKAYCNLATWSGSLPTYYQYFSDPTKGGNALADYCPYYESFENGGCKDTTEKNVDIHSDIRSADSMCFESTVVKTGQSAFIQDDCGQKPSVLCHRQQCVDSGTYKAKLRVYLGTDYSHYIDCPSSGGLVNVYDNLSSRSSSCRDDDKWTTGYARPANCRDFAGSCDRYENLGQYQKCPNTCRTCAAYDGQIMCPPIADVCATSSYKSNVGMFVAMGIGASVLGVLAFLGFKRRGGVLGKQSQVAAELTTPMISPEETAKE